MSLLPDHIPESTLPFHEKLQVNPLFELHQQASPENACFKPTFPTVTSVVRIVLNGDQYGLGETAIRKLVHEKTKVWITADEMRDTIEEVKRWFLIQGGYPWTRETGWEWNTINLGIYAAQGIVKFDHLRDNGLELAFKELEAQIMLTEEEIEAIQASSAIPDLRNHDITKRNQICVSGCTAIRNIHNALYFKHMKTRTLPPEASDMSTLNLAAIGPASGPPR